MMMKKTEPWVGCKKLCMIYDMIYDDTYMIYDETYMIYDDTYMIYDDT